MLVIKVMGEEADEVYAPQECLCDCAWGELEENRDRRRRNGRVERAVRIWSMIKKIPLARGVLVRRRASVEIWRMLVDRNSNQGMLSE